jgi:hypothetical protein
MITPATSSTVGGVKLAGILGGAGNANAPSPPDGYITPQMLSQVYALSSDLNTETARAEAAETAITQGYTNAVQAEITARIEAISEETEVRASADTAINEELATLSSEYSTNTASYNTLHALVTTLDTTVTGLSSDYSALSTALTSDVSTLTSSINSETTARQSADTTLQTHINTVTSAVATETSRAETAEALAVLKSNNLSDVPNKATARTNLGLGTSATTAASAYDTAGAAATVATNLATEVTRAEGVEATKLAKASNLSDLANAATARTNLQLGTAAVASASTFATAVNLAAETTRAEAAEATKANTSDISGLAATSALNAEITRAESAEALKATDTAVVHLAGTETVTGNKNFTGTLNHSGNAVVDTTDSRLTNTRAPSAGTVSDASIATGGLTDASISSIAAINHSKLDVTAQSGIAAGNTAVQSVNGKTGTSITLDATDVGALDPTLFVTAGQLIAGNGNDEFIILGQGTDGYILTADSTQPGGLRWGVFSGGGGSGTLDTITAADSSIVVGGTSTDVTLAVNGALYDHAGAAATAQSTAITTAEAYADSNKLARASNLSDLISATVARSNLCLNSAALQPASAFDTAGAASAAQTAAIAASDPAGAASAVKGLSLNLTGATASTRYVGATSSGQPSTGTFLTGDWIIDQTGGIWICRSGGTPGTWSNVVGGSTSVAGITAADATITIGGTGSNPTVKVTAGTYDLAGAASTAVATETTRATAAEASKAPLASPVLTGNPTAPTPTTGDNDTSIATTAFVTTAVTAEATSRTAGDALKANLASPTFTGTPLVPTAASGTNTTQAASTAFVNTAISTATLPPTVVASSATPAINSSVGYLFELESLAINVTSMTTNLTGTPIDGQRMLIRIRDNGTPRTIVWGASFVSSGIATLLATTVANQIHMVGLMYDSVRSAWVCVAVDATGY